MLEFGGDLLQIGDVESWNTDSTFFSGLPENAGVDFPDIGRSDLAYVYFTSGSTGQPKGVMVQHGSICTSLVAHGQRLGLCSTSRVLQATSYTFDPCLTEIFGTLIYGGCICVPPDLTHLVETINVLAVNWAFFTPSTISLLHPEEVPTLRTVSVGGEPLTQDCIDTWASKVRLYNSYGPTEACVFCCIASTEPTSSPSVIGHAVGCQSWIVDSRDPNKLAAIGEVGELLIEGEILARGYLNDPEKTAAAYITGLLWANPAIVSNAPRRFYKTGDLARINLDGTISCLGRRDKQVKIRGQRVELGDIESHIKQHLGHQGPNVFVELVERNMTDYLVAFLVLGSSHSTITAVGNWKPWCDDLQTKLSQSLPTYMIPGHIVPLQYLPMTTSGKVDRAALRDKFQKLHSQVAPELPMVQVQTNHSESHDEERIFKIEVARVLSLAPTALDLNHSFLELGGNSLHAIRLVSRLRKASIHLRTEEILQPISLFSLVSTSKAATRRITASVPQDEDISYGSTPDHLMESVPWVATQCGIALDSIESLQKCTSFQESLMPSLTSQPCTYVAEYRFQLSSGTDLHRFKTCWEAAYQAFPILRSRFVVAPAHGPIRAVAREQIAWNENGVDRLQCKMTMERMGAGTKLSAFSLSNHGESHEFILILHHLLYDEWSLQLCLEYVTQLYDNSPPPTLGPSFDRFVHFSIDAAKDNASQEFWRNELSSACVAQFPRLPFPNYRPKLNAIREIQVQHATSEKVRASVLVRAALGLAMGVYTGLEDICFGTVMSGRDANMPGVDEVVGPTLATIPVHMTWDATDTTSSFLDAAESQQREIHAHEQYGFQNIRKTSAAAALACDFQTMLVIQSPSPEDSTKHLFAERTENESRDSHALVLECTMGPEALTMEARFDTEAISTEQCERFLGLWEHILGQLSCVEGGTALGSLNLVSKADAWTLATRNGCLPFPSPGLVHDHLARWSTIQPDKIAIDSWDGKLTYRELDILTTRFAVFLVASNPSGIIPLHFPKGLPLIVCMWAVLKAGRAFLCLDTEAPADRLTHILEQLDRPLVLTHNAKSTRALALVNCWTIDKGYLRQLGWAHTEGPPLPVVNSHDIAYMIMTSGSTGRPKGVLIEHQSIMTTVAQSGPTWGIQKSSRMLQFPSVAFDAAVMDILSAVVHGACLCVPMQAIGMDALANFIKVKNVNWAFFTPSFLRLVNPSEFPGLETVAAGGEAMTTEVARVWAPRVNLVNAYGPCECAITCASTLVKADALSHSSIGKAIGCVLWIVDAKNHERLAPIGTVGELLIEGPIVGRGYLNDDEKTAAAFISPPSWTSDFPRNFCRMYKTGDLVRYDDDGGLLYIGRKDNQVKLRGQRLELGEVEHNVQQAASSRPALCFVPKKGPFANRLVAVLGGGSNNLVPVSEYRLIPFKLDGAMRTDIQKLRQHVASKVPAYMVPDHFVILRDMPISLSGKLDRKIIGTWVEQFTSQDESVFSTGTESRDSSTHAVPANPMETVLQTAWAAVLGLPPDKVGTNRSFQALGGDSITAMQAIARSRNKGFDISMKELLRGDTIQVLSRKVIPKENVSSRYINRNKDPSTALSPIQRLYSILAPMSQAHYFNQSVQMRSRRNVSPQDLSAALRAVVTRHPSLRTRYDFSDLSKPTQRVLDDAEASFSVASCHVSSKSARLGRLKAVQSIPDPVFGPIIHCELIDEEEGDQRIILVAPHLAVDIVSWRLILEDMETILEGATLGPTPLVSYQDWCDRTLQNQESGRKLPTPDYDYWGLDTSSLVYGEVETESFSLSSSATASCLGPNNSYLRSKPTDLFIGAISWAFHETFPDRESAIVCLEGHGRQSTGNDLDVTNTVGWFTTVMPVHVPIIPGEDLLQFFVRTKDARFRSEAHGVDFFKTQDLSNDKNVKIPEIMVNFTGIQRTDVEAGGLFVEDVDSSGDQYDFSDNMRRFAVFDIAICVKNGKLELELSFDKRIRQRNRIGNWLSKCKAVLEEISIHVSSTPPRPTLSDFPSLALSYDGLAVLESNMQELGISMLETDGPWVESVFPATPMQNQMLQAQQENPNYWRVSTLFKTFTSDSSPIEPQRLSTAWKKVIAANAALRTLLIPGSQMTAAGYINVVLGKLPLDDFVTISSSPDLSALPRTKWQLELPQHHLTIVQHGPKSVLCRLEISHALVDHSSMSVVLRCLSQAYEDGSVALNVVPYENYAMALSQAPSRGSLDFWTSYLRDASPSRVSDIKATDVREDKGIFSTPIDLTEVFESVKTASETHGITSATILRLAWALALGEQTNNADVVFGFISSGRDVSMPDIEHVVGPVLNVVASVQEDFFTTSQHQHYLATYLREQYGTNSLGLFDSVVNFRRHGAPQEDGGILSFEEWPGSEDPYEVIAPSNLQNLVGSEANDETVRHSPGN
ncbi:hypothetical protein TruAng_005316 [Truncatella angustata]|nr:hypothetical protein TruAng_005316 [Truncatella angustata]